jgi:hypothetical protein
MTIIERIEYDVKCLDVYFRKLFTMAAEASLQESSTVATSEESESFITPNVTAFIRFDMVCNVYSLVDFWLPRLCSFHERKSNLVLSYKDIKGASDLNAYHKYLTKVAALSLQNAQPSYDHLDNLRMVRNCDIHDGGHIKDEHKRIKFEQVPGITASGSLVIIADSFVWDSLNHAKVYLCAVAQA